MNESLTGFWVNWPFKQNSSFDPCHV